MDKKAKKQRKSQKKNTKHGRRAMVTTDGPWTVCKFEFDADGQGVAWHQGRGIGQSISVENYIRHFSEKGYTVVSRIVDGVQS